MISGIEWVIVLVVVAVMFFFGKDKVVSWAKAFGEAKKAFDDASNGKKTDDKKGETKATES